MLPMLSLSNQSQGRFGVCGHAGVGHSHGRVGLIHDDSTGFALSCYMLREATAVDTTISKVEANLAESKFIVTTASGGVGEARVRRGITPSELELAQRIIGRDGICTQTLAVQAFGRLYGQGVTETPVALQTAIALAVADSFVKAWPENVYRVYEDVPGNVGAIIGSVLELDGIPVAVLAIINASNGGVGPNEELEGNIMMGTKAELMKQLGLDTAPTVVVESKAYVPGLSKDLVETKLNLRANQQIDNMLVAESLFQAAQELGIPIHYDKNAFPYGNGDMKKATLAFCQRVQDTTQRLAGAESTYEKVQILAELARLISEDAGGVVFMCDDLHDRVRGTGMEPGTAATISMVVPQSYFDHYRIPLLTDDDLETISTTIKRAITIMAQK